MYKRYLHKYFLNYSITIDGATINLKKYRSCNRGNTNVISFIGLTVHWAEDGQIQVIIIK